MKNNCKVISVVDGLLLIAVSILTFYLFITVDDIKISQFCVFVFSITGVIIGVRFIIIGIFGDYISKGYIESYDDDVD